MSLKKEIKEIKKLFCGEKNKEVGQLTPEEIIDFKSNAWISDERASVYAQNMELEQLFFDAVTAKIFTQYIKPTDKVLDVGAGTGRLALKIAELGCEVTALDISQSMLNFIDAQKGNRKVTTVVSSADALPFEAETFDTIVQLDFLSHFPNWKELLKEQARICKTNGLILFKFYNGDNVELANENREVGVKFLIGGDFIANATKDEIMLFCDEYSFEAIAFHPYNYFYNTLHCHTLTQEEFLTFRTLLAKTFRNEKIINAITRFEQEIVPTLPYAEAGAMMVVALRKK